MPAMGVIASLSFSMLPGNDGVGSGNEEWRENCETKSVKVGTRVLVEGQRESRQVGRVLLLQ